MGLSDADRDPRGPPTYRRGDENTSALCLLRLRQQAFVPRCRCPANLPASTPDSPSVDIMHWRSSLVSLIEIQDYLTPANGVGVDVRDGVRPECSEQNVGVRQDLVARPLSTTVLSIMSLRRHAAGRELRLSFRICRHSPTRFDAINVFDQGCEIRDSTGVGVGVRHHSPALTI